MNNEQKEIKRQISETQKALENLQSALAAAEEPEFDVLSVLPIGSPVLCSSSGSLFQKRFYAGNGRCFTDGATCGNGTKEWKYIIPDPDAVNILAFKVHDGGKCPVDVGTEVVVITRKGERLKRKASRIIWNYESISNTELRIALYAVAE